MVVVLRLVGISDDLAAAEGSIQAASTALEDGRIADARTALDVASAQIEVATASLYNSPELGLVGWVPVVSDNLRSLEDSLGLISSLVHGGRRILTVAEPLEGPDGRFEISIDNGRVPIEPIERARVEIDTLVGSLPGGPRSGSSRLVGPVDDLRRRVDDEVALRRDQLDGLRRALGIVSTLSGAAQDRRYLISVANTAEMRGSGGMMLNYGVLEARGGVVSLEQFGRIDDLALTGPVPPEFVDLPDDYLARWDGFDVTQRWRNANMAADYEVVAPVFAAMYEASTGEAVDGVIQIDPAGLAQLLSFVGPVTVDEVGVVTAANVVDVTLNQAYIDFPDVEQRTEVLQAVAEAAIDRLFSTSVTSIRDLGELLHTAVQERHLLVYSVGSSAQAHLRYFGATGGLPPADSAYFLLGTQNVSANKLDYYLDTALELRGEATGEITAEVRLHNTAPVGLTEPSYIFGPFDSSQQAGVYRGVVSLYVPRGTSVLEAEVPGAVGPPIVVAEDGRTVVSYTTNVPAGVMDTASFRLRLPPGVAAADMLELVPTPRVRPTRYDVEVTTTNGALRSSGVLESSVRLAVES